MKIPFLDLKAQYRAIGGEVERAIARVIEDCAFISGKYAARFEDSFARYCEAAHCVGVGNGTDALILALEALGIGAGDEVLVPANSFVATSEAVTRAGARVVFVDVDPATYTLDVEAAEARIGPRTRAIIAVHLFGLPADLVALRQLADAHGLRLVQDCAQAHGARLHGRPLSHYGDVLCFSFYPGKNLGAYGDAGAIVADDGDLARRCRMLANHGRISKYDHELEGVNSRLDGIQAAVLSVKLRYLEEWIRARRALAAGYERRFAGHPAIARQQVAEGARHVYHLYTVRTRRRDALRAWLSDRDIGVGIHYPVALPNLTAYRHLGHRPEDFPVASRYQDELLSLPIYPELDAAAARRVTEEVAAFFEARADRREGARAAARR